MKKILLIIIAFISVTRMNAQDVLNEILRSSDKIINDTTKSMETRQVAMFKFSAATYMRNMILPAYVMLDKNANADTINSKIRSLNEQAYAMSVYISAYKKRLGEVKPKNKYVITSIFKQATYENKLFDDKDIETTLAYYNKKDAPIPFCIDCDWVKTLAFIRTIDWSKF